MNNVGAKIVLEARINKTGTNDPCRICGGWKERTELGTETYIAETEHWVCYDCALEIDRDLARFAYDASYCPKLKRKCEPEHFGLCPACGQAGEYKSIGPDHWYFFARHGLKWFVGSNLFSGWRDLTEDEWESNSNFLSRFRETDPYYPEPTSFERTLRGLHEFWAEVRPQRCPDVPEEEMLIPDVSEEERLLEELRILRPIAERAGKRRIVDLIEYALRNGSLNELEEAKRAFLGDEDLYAQLPDNITPF